MLIFKESGAPHVGENRYTSFWAILSCALIESVRNWVIETVVRAAISKLVATFSGFGAIAVAAQGIYNAIAFLIEQADRIQALVDAVAASIGNIVAGQVSEAANYIESSLARSVSVAISCLARIVGLGNLGQKVREIIGRVGARVDVAVNKLVDLVAKQGNDWLAKAGGGRPSNAAGGSGRPGSQRPVPPNRTGQPRTPVTQNPRSGQPRTPATRNPAPVPSPRSATRNPAPTPSPRPASRKPQSGQPQNRQTQPANVRLGDGEVGKTINFRAKGENHRLWIEVLRSLVRVMVASTPSPVESKLKQWQGRLNELQGNKRTQAQQLLEAARTSLSTTQGKGEKAVQEMGQAQKNPTPQAIAEFVSADNQTEAAQESLAELIRQLFELFGEQDTPEAEQIRASVAIAQLRQQLQQELAWYQTQIYQAEEILQPLPTEKRTPWASYLKQLNNNKKQLGYLPDEIRELETRWNDTQGVVAADPAYLELAQPDFADIREDAESTLKRLIAIKRPTRPAEEASETQPEEKSSLNLKDKKALAVRASSPLGRVIENPRHREAWLLYSVAEKVDELQVVMNDLYREDAQHGDGSTAFIVLLEQFRAGVGNEPKPIVGDTKHEVKARNYSDSNKGLSRLLNELPKELKRHFPQEAIERIEAEIKKLREAVQWAEKYRNGDEPNIPTWAKDWSRELGK